MDCIVHGVAKSQTQLSNFHFHTFTFLLSLLFLFVVYFWVIFLMIALRITTNILIWSIIIYNNLVQIKGFPGGTRGKEPLCQCRKLKRLRLDPWVGKIPWKRAWQPVVLKVREWATRLRTEHENWCNGSGGLQPLLDWGGSPLWVQLLFLIADYKTFFDLSFPRHYIDIVPISLFSPQTIPFWDSLGNNQQVCRQCSHLMLTRCSKVHAFMIPVILSSGSGLGVCNKAIILRKTWKTIINTVSWCMHAVFPGAVSKKFLKAVKVHYWKFPLQQPTPVFLPGEPHG